MDFLILVPAFLFACLVGGWAVRLASTVRPMVLIAATSAMTCITIVGALIGAAEVSDDSAKYLSLAAIVLLSAAMVGSYAAARRMLAAERKAGLHSGRD